MPDLSSVAREAAETVALGLYPSMGPDFPEINRSRRLRQKAYIKGFTECASRLPSVGEIAAVLLRHNFDDLLLGNIEWDGYTAVCACGWSSEEYKMPGDAHEAHSEHAASNLLALIGEKISMR